MVKVASARGWPPGGKPVAAQGTSVAAFAWGLDHPRWLYVLPNGDVLVAETNAPKRPEDNKGIKGWFFKRYQKKAGGAVPSANRITLLRDADGDGVAETRSVLVSGLNSPFGMVLVSDTLYVANTDAVVRFPYSEGQTRITAAAAKVADLPGGPLNHHWTKSLIASLDGSKLYVGVGSNSNVAEHGMVKEEGRAAIWEIDRATGRSRVFATGLRNPVGMAWQPDGGVLWTAVNERDELGGDLVPDYMTSVRDGGFYGWPYSYFGQHVDTRVKPRRPDLVASAIPPDYALGPHTASLGLAWSDGSSLPPPFGRGMFVGQHGSWNRYPRSGYKVIFVPFAGSTPSGPPIDVLTGFLADRGDAYGRPVGVAIDKHGALLVADDVGNTIWRVTSSPAPATAQKRPAGPAPGRLVSIGGHKLHIRCVGPTDGRPAVILEAGGGGFSSAWSQVQDLLSPRVRTCAYDRAGSGWSEPGPAPRTMRQEVFELHALLEAARVPGPFVLVGHSLGGLLARLYAEQYGSDVVGVVLVDPAHESDMLGSVRHGGLVRLREKATGRAVPEPRREGKASTQYNPDDDYLAEELQQIYLSRNANPVPLGDRPLIVVAAGRRPAPPGTADELWSQLRVEKDGQRIDLARLSRNSRFILDPSSGHQIPSENPRLVARAIEEVVEAASKGTRLAP